MGARQANPNAAAKRMREKREARRLAKLCVNSDTHGPAAPGCGGRCQTCHDNRRSARTHPVLHKRTT